MQTVQRVVRSGIYNSVRSTSKPWHLRAFCATGGAEKKAAEDAAPKVAAAAATAAAEVAPKAKAATPKSGNTPLKVILFGGLAAAAYLKYNSSTTPESIVPAEETPAAPVKDYAAVAKAIADILDSSDYDDGSYGPVLVRLAWHASGTYDKTSGTGGSNGATMRFVPECEHAANAGLAVARALLEPVKARFPWISYADLWTLGGKVAIEEMGGPEIPWRSGRVDVPDGVACPPDGRLPDASLGAAHIQDVFGRMGFNDREAVALIGAHTVGRCHTDRSGYVNPWTNAPTTFSNLFFQDLTTRKWRKKKWNGPVQYEDQTKQLMMLPTDMALLWTRKYKPIVYEYAKDQDAFFRDFAAAFSKLLELGVQFPEDSVSL